MQTELISKIKKAPLLGSALVLAKRLIAINKNGVRFVSSAQYWNDRYKAGGTSGPGSYGRLAEFKAGFLNKFVEKHDVQWVAEYGCGDGAQLSLAKYPRYVGFDVAPLVVNTCREKYRATKGSDYEFHETTTRLEKEGDFDLAISLDVIYHLIEDDVFENYMRRLFDASKKYVIIYAYNFEKTYKSQHERGREFLKWCQEHAQDWVLIETIKNPYPYNKDDPNNTSQSDFFIFQKAATELR